MAINNLTNTTWVNKETWSATASLGIFNISGSVAAEDGTNTFTDMRIGYWYLQDDDEFEPQANCIAWNSSNPRPNRASYPYTKAFTITITGGTDVTNANLISWLTSNATQQATSASIVLGNNTLTGVDTIKLTNANDTTSTVDFVYGTTPSGTINVKLGNTTLTGVNQVNVLGTDTTYKSFGYVAQASGFTVTFAKSSRPTFATMDAYRQYSLDGTTWNNIALAMDGTSLENVTSIYFRVNGNGSNTGNISWTNPTGSLSPDFDFTSTWKTSGEVVLTGNMTATFGNSNNPE